MASESVRPEAQSGWFARNTGTIAKIIVYGSPVWAIAAIVGIPDAYKAIFWGPPPIYNTVMERSVQLVGPGGRPWTATRDTTVALVCQAGESPPDSFEAVTEDRQLFRVLPSDVRSLPGRKLVQCDPLGDDAFLPKIARGLDVSIAAQVEQEAEDGTLPDLRGVDSP